MRYSPFVNLLTQFLQEETHERIIRLVNMN